MPAFARELGVNTKAVPEQLWLNNRNKVMRQAFYRYAGNNSSEIDGHLIHQALDLWSWFWVGVQSAVVFVLTSLLLIAMQHYVAGAITLGSTLVFVAIGLPAIRLSCRRYAIAQVKAIMADPARETIVRQAFDWVEIPAYHQRRSA
ncbi:MAG: hypothetical protein MKZ95_01705 [Pirellulales bacterium]|nr:hypothetical protein [Pirellulales bacterium]